MRLRALGAVAFAMPVVLALALAAAPCALEAQPAVKTPRVGVLLTARPPRAHTDAFTRALADLGYVEGKTVVIDVIVTGGTQAARAAKQATTTIPIVMASGGDPVGAGLVASLARPGGNVTGMSSLAHGIVRKQFEPLVGPPTCPAW